MTIFYTISELAQEFGITTRTLRHYEDKGLFEPHREGIRRKFSGRDRTRLKLALRSKRLGLSLAEIRELFMLYDASTRSRRSEEFLTKIADYRVRLERQREDIQIMLSEILFFETQHEKHLETT
jgi:DNA-binding transcriptional MerR regulator